MVHRSLAAAVLASTLLVTPGPAIGSAPPTSAPAEAQVAAEDFGTPPEPLPAGADGDVIRHEPFALYGGLIASAERIMYLSRDTHGRQIAVTGAVLTPNAPWSGAGDRPIVGYAVGTQGMGDKCAPSTLLETGIEYEGVLISGLLARGYGVAVTDYQGLGTPGTHTYVNRAAEGQAVLDAIRAAQRLPEANLPDAGPVATAGYSQGGGASAAAAELQPEYAPELDLRGSYAGAPPADLKVVGHNLDGHYAAAFLAYAILSLEAAYPDQVDLDEILNERGERLAAQVNEECVWESIPLHALTQSRDLTEDGRPVTAYMDEEPFDTLVEEQRIGLREPAVPVLVLHSWLDDIVPYDQGRRMARDWCGLGADVEFRTLAVPTHVGGYAESAPYVLGWLEARFAGAPTAGNCGSF